MILLALIVLGFALVVFLKVKKIKELNNEDLNISINTNFINQAKIILQIIKSDKKYSILNYVICKVIPKYLIRQILLKY